MCPRERFSLYKSEGALRSAAPSDFAPAASHEDLARGGDRNLCPGRRSAAVGVLQRQLQESPLLEDGGEGGRKANPSPRRHGGVEHELAGGALGMDSGRNDQHLRDPPAAATTLAEEIGISSS